MHFSGVKTETAVSAKTILYCNEPKVVVGIQAANTNLVADALGKKILKAGTPMAGNLENRAAAFALAQTADAPVSGVYTIQITVAATAGDKLIINGTTYEAAAAEDVAEKKFAVGADAAAQVTSLLKMLADDNFAFAAVAGASDKIQLTEKFAAAGIEPEISVTKAAGTGAMTIVQATTVFPIPNAGASNAVGILLHDIDVTAGTQNAELMIFGFINLNKLDAVTVALITAPVKAALFGKVHFLKD